MTEAGSETNSAHVRLLALITAVGVILRLYGLGSQPPTVDDQSVLISAINFMESGQLGPTMWNHPGLRNILAYGMLKSFGSGQAGTLGLNILLGSLCTPLVYAVARRLTGSATVSLIAALFWGVEPLAIEYSRQAINDIYLAFFPLAGILAVYRYLESDRPAWLVIAGASFGLGLASKWSALFQLAIMGLFVVYRLFRPLRERGVALAARALFVVSCLVVIPLTIYLASFAPWFGRGYSLSEWTSLQQAMYRETKLHTGYKKEIYGDHQAWQWFLRPGISHEDYIFTLNDGQVESSLRNNLKVLKAVANPLVWLAVIPAFLLLAWRARRERSEGLTLLVALFCCSYLPMAVAPRPIWFNTGVVVLPYVVMLVAYAVGTCVPPARTKLHRIFVPTYLTVTCLISIGLFPLAIGKGFDLPVVGDYLLAQVKNLQGVSKDSYGNR